MKWRRTTGFALLLLGALIIFIIFPKTGVSLAAKNVQVPLTNTTELIAIHASNMDISLIPEARADVEAYLQGGGKVSAAMAGSEFQLDAERGRFTLLPLNCTLVVRIPLAYRNHLAITLDDGDIAAIGPSGEGKLSFSLKSLAIQAKSSKTELNRLETGHLTFDAASGTFRARNVQADLGKITMTTGSIQLQNYSGNVESRLESGEINASGIRTGTGSFESTSGEIHLEHYSGKLHGVLGAGEFQAGFDLLSDTVDVAVGRGRAELTLPAKADVRLEADITRGNSDIRRTFDRVTKQTSKEFAAISGAAHSPLKSM
ncbi:DUF4097 domain-containing protein [Paenibacillus sp. P25]|nr:DUF4097 domain-containing protein [Paenibacillus sp. P25]